MKKRFGLSGLLVALVIAVLFWLFTPRPTGSRRHDNQPSPPLRTPLPSSTTAAAGIASQRSLASPSNQFAESSAEIVERRDKEIRAAGERANDDWRTPIEFYGKVIDENTNPVISAQISFSCNDLSATGTSCYHATSDRDGFFSITGISGKLLSVSVVKGGYYSSKRDNGYFTYAGGAANFVSDRENPVVFHLRKKRKTEFLIHFTIPLFGQIAQLSSKGRPLEINLLQGHPCQPGSGQLVLEYRTTVPETTNKRPYTWNCRLFVRDGGIQAADEEFNFVAPADGYGTSVEIAMDQASCEDWREIVEKSYYLKLNNGTYGRIRFKIMGHNGVYNIESFVNPAAGSRNLEYDPQGENP